VGFTHIQGMYPCPNPSARFCGFTPDRYLDLNVFSQSFTVEVRAQLIAEITRFWRLSPIFLTELGVGVEVLTSKVVECVGSPNEHCREPFRNDGPKALVSSSLGLGLRLSLAQTPDTVASEVWLAASFQSRFRFPNMFGSCFPSASDCAVLDAPGVSDHTGVLWVLFGGRFAPPRSIR
jgi:hypothetical protein